MFFNLKNRNNEIEESIRFLNSSARDFYNGYQVFEFRQYGSFFKSNLLSVLIDLERVIKGMFGCDIFMKNANIDDLKIMFPNATSSIFKLNNEDDLKMMGREIETLRNMNAHAFLSNSDFSFFDFDFSSLETQKTFNNKIKYYDNGVTIAGIIFIILNFLRVESINSLIKRDEIFSLVACGEICKKSSGNFINEISGVNLECEIRKTIQHDLSGSIIGEFSKFNLGNPNEFNVEIGSHKYPTFKATGMIKDNCITMFQGSLTKTFYETEYNLKIEDTDLFIELSNELPPFALLDYLYACGITKFNKEEISKCNIELAKKLNKPKFYTDKNIFILNLPSTVSDYRLISSVVADAVVKISLQLEEYIYKTKEILQRGTISSIAKALSFLNVSNECIKDIKYIRNFSSHGYALSDYSIYENEVKQFTLDYVIKSLENLLSELKEKSYSTYRFVCRLVCIHFVNVLVSAKYKLGIILGREILQKYPYFNKKDMIIKNGFIHNSYLDVSKLENLVIDNYLYIKVIKLNIKNTDEEFYINDNEIDHQILDQFLVENGFKMELIKSNSLIKEYCIEK